MTETIFDDTIAAGGTVSVVHDFRRGNIQEQRYAYFFDGDGNSGDMTIVWRVKPQGETQFYNVEEADVTNVDLSGGEQFLPELRGGVEHEIEVTNNGASGAALKIHAVPYK